MLVWLLPITNQTSDLCSDNQNQQQQYQQAKDKQISGHFYDNWTRVIPSKSLSLSIPPKIPAESAMGPDTEKILVIVTTLLSKLKFLAIVWRGLQVTFIEQEI